MIELLIPEHEEGSDRRHPGGIEPRLYSHNEVIELLRTHKNDPDAIQFIADMLEM